MEYSYTSLRHQHNTLQKRKERPLWPIILLIVFITFTIFFLKNRFTQSKILENVPDSMISEQNQNPTGIEITMPSTQQEFLSTLKRLFEGKVGTYSIYIYDLKENRGFGINEQTVMTAASVAKIPILATLYHMVSAGDIDIDKTITLRQEDIQDFGTGSIRYTQPGTTYSLKTLARLMMEKSDNTAAHILGRLIIGMPKIQEYIEKLGLQQTDMENNKTSAVDMELLMAKIYQGEIANSALTSEMLGFMKDTDFEDRLPAKLPKDITVYHKTGDEIGNIHDVGIIVTPNNTYYLGIFALDLLIDENQVKQLEAEASRMIYEYMESSQKSKVKN